MRTTVRILLVAMLLSACARGLAAEAGKGSHLSADDNNCIKCHGEEALWEGDQKRLYVPAESLANDVHFKNGVNCHDCHGGDPSSMEVNDVHSTEAPKDQTAIVGFRSPLSEVKKVCENCHKEMVVNLRMSVHGQAGEKDATGRGGLLACTACHGGKIHGLLPVKDPQSPVFLDHQVKICGGCHEEWYELYKKSVHGMGLSDSGLTVTAGCADCHGSHGIFFAAHNRSTLYTENVAATCGKCHRFIEERLKKSIHGRGNGVGHLANRAAPGGKEKKTPTCTDCHQGHDLQDPKSTAFRLQLPSRCGNCHVDLSSRYAMSLHGQLTELGYGPGAKCSDCHGAHDILPVNDPNSRVSSKNRLETCKACHPYAVKGFTDFHPHADYKDPQGSPALYYVHVGMEMLLFSVFGFFGLHTLLWFARSLAHTFTHGRPKRILAGRPAFVRFEPIHRVLHVIVIVSFLGLALTGLPLKYSDHHWAKVLAGLFGGFDSTSIWHHVCAVATIFYFSTHLTWMSRKVVARRGEGVHWKVILFGPDSPVPNFRDLFDLLRMARWFVGLGPKPVFERWTYWEKFDYWAVFWGVGIIGASGLILWFPNLFTRFLPGVTLNIAKVIHSEEALLATGFIFAIHFFNTHLRAEKFPIDLAVLTGLVSEEEMKEERPEYLERLRAEGQLEAFRDTAPSRTKLLLIILGGFIALAIGLALLAGILFAALEV